MEIMTQLSSIVDKFGVYVYKSPIIWFRMENHGNWQHREFAMNWDFCANAYICKLDEELFTKDPIFDPDFLTPPSDEKPNPDYDEKAAREWREEGWRDLLIDKFNMSRVHSFCVVRLYEEPPYWRVFTWRHIKKIYYSKKGIPYKVDCEWSHSLPKADTPTEHKESFNLYDNIEGKDKNDALLVPFGSRNRKHLGHFDFESIWDLLIYIRYQMLDMVNNSAKTSGFYHFIYGDSIGDDHSSDLKDALDFIGISQGIGASKRILEAIEFHCPEHPEFTIDALNKSVNLLAGSVRLPFSFFMGEKEGGGVFQEGFSDEAKVTKKKNYIFSQFKKYIIDLVRMRWGKDIKDVKPYIDEEVQEEQDFEQEAESKFTSDHFQGNKNQIKNKL
jgi:hypothetical protein